jgi:hypothetical protein
MAAYQVTLCAVAFLLHHELAHARLRHEPLPPGASSIEHERDADYEAASWILGAAKGKQFDKRTLGVAVSLAAMVGLRLLIGSDPARTHPCSFERPINTLAAHIHDPNHQAWGLAIVILTLYLDRERIPVPENHVRHIQG